MFDRQRPEGKQPIAALARGLGVVWRRISTDQTTPKKPGLVLSQSTATKGTRFQASRFFHT
ncbi:MAG: hypothetical protein DME24_17200 [Verrucomicrobia bacterium]|nr:MAG: hypothetical protein DME24_17200 [Verrucomicrobiota bacterium]